MSTLISGHKLSDDSRNNSCESSVQGECPSIVRTQELTSNPSKKLGFRLSATVFGGGRTLLNSITRFVRTSPPTHHSQLISIDRLTRSQLVSHIQQERLSGKSFFLFFPTTNSLYCFQNHSEISSLIEQYLTAHPGRRNGHSLSIGLLNNFSL